MSDSSVDISATVKRVEKLLQEEPSLSPAMKGAIEMLLLVVKLLADRLGLNSHNSSKPPSTDPARVTRTRKARSGKPRGGQPGHAGVTLQPVAEPDFIEAIAIDRRSLPPGNYQVSGDERRQVIEISISRVVTEFRAQVLTSDAGDRYVATFPPGVSRPVQYGASVKANAVYMSLFQLIPYERIQTHFDELFEVPLSAGTLCNFNRDAFDRLEVFSELAKRQLHQSGLLHVDETGINVNGQRLWLHNASDGQWTYFCPHPKRGSDAMEAMGILPGYRGILCHDHWKPYYQYACEHALCNAHHLRELTRAFEQDGQQWAEEMGLLLTAINKDVQISGGRLSPRQAGKWRKKYRDLLLRADLECPPPEPPGDGPKRGRIKRSKSRNLLERLRKYEEDTLRFMENEQVPFTNNQGERDLRMTKVQQKISGCFRSMEGAETFCRVRSYLSTCRKQGVGVGEALECLFRGDWPDFIQQILDQQAEYAE